MQNTQKCLKILFVKQHSLSVVRVCVEQEQRRNEVFIDVIERLMVSIAADVC